MRSRAKRGGWSGFTAASPPAPLCPDVLAAGTGRALCRCTDGFCSAAAQRSGRRAWQRRPQALRAHVAACGGPGEAAAPRKACSASTAARGRDPAHWRRPHSRRGAPPATPPLPLTLPPCAPGPRSTHAASRSPTIGRHAWPHTWASAPRGAAPSGSGIRPSRAHLPSGCAAGAPRMGCRPSDGRAMWQVPGRPLVSGEEEASSLLVH